MTYDKDTARDTFRNAVLEAMDKAAWQIFGQSITRNDCGATDADLPRLFKCLDEQLDIISGRFNHPLYNDYIGSDRYMAERAQLQSLGISPINDDAL